MNKYKCIIASIAIGLTCSCLPVTANAESSMSGVCDNGIMWELSDNTLTITGTGEMFNYTFEKDIPWYKCKESIVEVVINEGITSIGKSSFADCANLTSVVLPANLEVIDYRAFYKCTNLESIIIPEGVRDIGVSAFYQCESLKDIALPDSLKTIGTYAFYKCNSLESIDITGDISVVDSKAFQSCESLREVVFTECVDKIKSFAFNNCVALETIILPEGLKELGMYSFADCENLKSIDFPSTLEFIDDYAFRGCNSLKYIDVPDNVNNIGAYAFSYCDNLKSVRLPQIEIIHPSMFMYSKELNNIVIPETVKTIKSKAFYGCYDLRSIELPESVETIGSNAFTFAKSLDYIWFNNPYCEIYDSNETIPITSKIYGYEGSTAQEYAEKYGNDFRSLGPIPPEYYEEEDTELIKGDANGDNQVDILDVILINKVIFGKASLTPERLPLVDFNHNGMPDAGDSLTLMKFLVGLIDTLD